MSLEIIHEDSEVIIVLKQAGIPSQQDKSGDENMLSMLSKHLKGAYVGLVHRLDRPVGGIMVFAKTPKALEFLSKQIQDKSFDKQYLTVVCGKPKECECRLTDLLWKNERLNLSKVVSKGTNNAKEAILEYKLLGTVSDEKYGQLSLLRVFLYTGRHHQIRVQLSNAGLPIWGDNKYNESFLRSKGIGVMPALWSESVSFIHPKTKKDCSFLSVPMNFPFTLWQL